MVHLICHALLEGINIEIKDGGTWNNPSNIEIGEMASLELSPGAQNNSFSTVNVDGNFIIGGRTFSDLTINVNEGGALSFDEPTTLSSSVIVNLQPNTILGGNSTANIYGTWNSGASEIDNINLNFYSGSSLNLTENVTVKNSASLSFRSGIDFNFSSNMAVEGLIHLLNANIEGLTVDILNQGTLSVEGDVSFDANSTISLQSGSVATAINSSTELAVYGGLIANPGSEITGFRQDDLGGITYQGSGPFALDQANITNTEITATFDGYNPQIENCNFSNSPLYMMGLESHGCYIANNQFANTTGAAALKIEGFPTYTISGNTFTDNQTHAISLYKAGRKTEREHLIINNTIHHNSDLNAAKGIVMYGSVADIRDNIIHSNDYGLGIYHNSSVRMWGDPELASQQVYANEYNQIFAADNSFPWYFKWNIIQDADNPNHIIYCKDDKPVRYDVRDNCWGDKFNPNDDLYPTLAFTWDPAWDCGINADGSGTGPAPRVAYETSLEQIANEDYAGAETQLQSIVETWPDSKYAATAMKTMPDVAVKRNNLDQLISYFNTNATIQADEDLKKLAGYLTADCNVIKTNYQQALDFYAGIIDNPPTPEDETYAIIDASYVHYLMDEGNKAQGTFKHAELIPKTRQAYVAKRKQLLDEIGAPELEANQEQETVEESENLQNFNEGLNIYPNPVSGKVNLEIYTQKSGEASIEIMNTSGQCVYSHTISDQAEGKINHSLSTTNMASGIYYVQVRINDKYVTGKKMVVY